MRRILTLMLAVVAVMAMVPVAAPAQESIKIAVPVYIPVDGELDMVVLTGYPSYTVEADGTCFGTAGTYPVYAMVVQDETSSQAGRVTGVVADREFKAGTRVRQMGFMDECTIGATDYRVYQGYLTEGRRAWLSPSKPFGPRRHLPTPILWCQVSAT